MARRRLPDEPNSKLAIWSRRFALFSVAAALIAIIIVRAGLIEVLPGIVTFAGALAFAGLGILLALGSLITIWRQGLGGLGYAVTAISVGAFLLAYPAYLGYKAYKLPPIYDITTDILDPPAFNAVRRLRSRATNPAQYAGLYAAEQQREAYPEVTTLELTVSPKIAYDQVLALVNKRRWLVMDAREPHPKRREGRIEAVARTPVMGFREDMVIRIRGNEEEVARRYAIILALRIPRHRQQRGAHPKLPRQRRGKYRRCARARGAQPSDTEKGAACQSQRSARRASGQAVMPRNRRHAFGCYLAARHHDPRDAPAPIGRRRRSGADRSRYRSRAPASVYPPAPSRAGAGSIPRVRSGAGYSSAQIAAHPGSYCHDRGNRPSPAALRSCGASAM